MGVLKLAALAAVALAGCYSPQLRDCAVSCTADTDCAPDQNCGGDGLCAAPGTSCGGGGPVDAAGLDAPRDAPPDGPANTVQLRVRIMDQGKVTVVGVATCDSMGPTQGNCLYNVLPNVVLTLRATPAAGRVFDKWDSPTCMGSGATCFVTLTMPLTEVRAKFKNN